VVVACSVELGSEVGPVELVVNSLLAVLLASVAEDVSVTLGDVEVSLDSLDTVLVLVDSDVKSVEDVNVGPGEVVDSVCVEDELDGSADVASVITVDCSVLDTVLSLVASVAPETNGDVVNICVMVVNNF
jgi:hypothetical protein